ncbi:unnamed protein product, partial [Vitis vinifera]
MDSTVTKEVATELLPIIRVYKDGTVERLMASPIVPPFPEGDPQTGVLSKDISFSITPDSSISARLYLPKLPDQQSHKLPILVYFHGGGFCIESASSFLVHRYLNILVSQAKVVVVSVDYRLAPEHLLPIAYDDCWDALNWFLPFLRVYKDGSIDRLVDPPSVPPSLDDPDTGVSSKDIIISPDTGVSARIYLPKLTNTHQKLPILVYFHGDEPWLTQHGNFDRIFIGGDSAGGNIAHNTVMRAGTESLPNGVRILGAFLSQPYFWGSQPIGSESVEDHHQKVSYRIWKFLGCRRLLVCVAGKDELRDRDVRYYEAVRESGWEGEVELYEEKEEGHVFHIFNPESENAKNMVSRLVAFLQMK